MKTIHVRYFAVLRERRGVAAETLQTDAATWGDLYAELDSVHRFALDPRVVRVAVGEAFVEADDPTVDGATVVFVPPVAGG